MHKVLRNEIHWLSFTSLLMDRFVRSMLVQSLLRSQHVRVQSFIETIMYDATPLDMGSPNATATDMQPASSAVVAASRKELMQAMPKPASSVTTSILQTLHGYCFLLTRLSDNKSLLISCSHISHTQSLCHSLSPSCIHCLCSRTCGLAAVWMVGRFLDVS